MNSWVIGYIGLVSLIPAAYILGRIRSKEEIHRLKLELLKTPEEAPKFRIRTAEANPNRRAKVSRARIRAIRYDTSRPPKRK